MFDIYDKAIKNLGVINYALFGIPSTEEEFYEMFKPVVGKDETETVIYASTPEQYTITFSQLQSEVARLQAIDIATEYQRLRAPEYPSIGDQLDALWKGGDAATEMLARVQAVKTKYPKPE